MDEGAADNIMDSRLLKARRTSLQISLHYNGNKGQVHNDQHSMRLLVRQVHLDPGLG